MTIGILFILSSLLTYDCCINSDYNTWHSEYNDNIIIDNENLQLSKASGRIHINNNWSEAIDAEICTGNGTYSDPYIIEDWVITTFPESGILIENSNASLIIENCSIGHAADPNAGIELVNVNNSQIINNDCSQNYYGILLQDCNNITISGNTAGDTESFGYTLRIGIKLTNSNDNIIIGNTANYSGGGGISLHNCDNNVISGNIIDNNYLGMWLASNHNTAVAGNHITNNSHEGIMIRGVENYEIRDNIIVNNTGAAISIESDSSNVFVHSNKIKNNTEGVVIDDASHHL